MKKIISGKTRLVGLLGDPVEHSSSPYIQNAAFTKLGLDYVYMAFTVNQENLTEGVQALKTLDALGFNVTMPNKEAIIPLLDEVSKEAKLIGAVNTVKITDKRLKGYNTDGMGFVKSLREEGISLGEEKFVLAGAGGAARSIAVQLALEGAKEIVILSRKGADGEVICNGIRDNIPGVLVNGDKLTDAALEKELKTAGVFVNCTPLGMKPREDQSVIPDPKLLRKDLVVSDIIYSPRTTRLMKMAVDRGCKVIGGMGMLLGQGALAFEIWTGEKMPVDAVKSELFYK
ncbi:shikimate dehydrogenase [Isachenkonia alkalipeptolytica]|uniref:Shikimate dehydrogenase (NADP(+)) n=1 Tax=Isachenkonia alkalipeptolytica TaxID=2565777 RepID=A0AA44BDI5_9CLOT|nr:shikimate dehydrogenase [Isachenkonia alkalipeptolytica]NBG87165.1 shikimate dehydrogenase [Isachenkonia alkalipeptolytica]